MFLFCVPNLFGIFIDYLVNLENVVANLNLEIFQEKLQIFSVFPIFFVYCTVLYCTVLYCIWSLANKNNPAMAARGTEQEVNKF